MKAVVLLSGGLDSTTALAVALREDRDCWLLCANYGQRHQAEVDAAMDVADAFGLDIQVVNIPALGVLAHSALTSDDVRVPKDRIIKEMADGMQTTYVPARNTVLLGLALACAESIDAREIWTGFNVIDAGGYPDCRPDFVRAFEALANVATAPGAPWSIRTPLIDLTKAQIVELGTRLGVPFGLTHSCYDPVSGRKACGRCDACILRRQGFLDAGVPDPTQYA